ncbi:hypothetical protein BY996DRAFT_8465109, partial [Phakopsora pachyrhizi]
SCCACFGATGFLGRYLIHKLAKKGTQVIVPYQEEDSKRHLCVMGGLGQIVPLEFNLQNKTSINVCSQHFHLVYNLIGRDYKTKNYSFDLVFVNGAAKITQITKDNDINCLIHISHLNASHDSPSKFYQAKASGEDKVKLIFPDVTIVRRSTFFGQED